MDAERLQAELEQANREIESLRAELAEVKRERNRYAEAIDEAAFDLKAARR